MYPACGLYSALNCYVKSAGDQIDQSLKTELLPLSSKQSHHSKNQFCLSTNITPEKTPVLQEKRLGKKIPKASPSPTAYMFQIDTRAPLCLVFSKQLQSVPLLTALRGSLSHLNLKKHLSEEGFFFPLSVPEEWGQINYFIKNKLFHFFKDKIYQQFPQDLMILIQTKTQRRI